MMVEKKRSIFLGSQKFGRKKKVGKIVRIFYDRKKNRKKYVRVEKNMLGYFFGSKNGRNQKMVENLRQQNNKKNCKKKPSHFIVVGFVDFGTFGSLGLWDF